MIKISDRYFFRSPSSCLHLFYVTALSIRDGLLFRADLLPLRLWGEYDAPEFIVPVEPSAASLSELAKALKKFWRGDVITITKWRRRGRIADVNPNLDMTLLADWP